MTLEELSKRLESKNLVTVSRGTGPLSLLGIAFIILKLLGLITWSWWWVLAPFWIPFAIILALLLFGIVVITIISAIEAKNRVKVTKENIEAASAANSNNAESNTNSDTPKKKSTRSKKSKANGESTEEKN